MTRDLNLNLGLRWDFEGRCTMIKQDLSTFDPSQGGLVVVGQQIEDLYPRSWKNFSPRLGYRRTSRAGATISSSAAASACSTTRRRFRRSSIRRRWRTTARSASRPIRPARSPSIRSRRNGYTIVPNQPIFPPNLSISGNNVINLFSVSPNFQPAYVTSYNVNVEKSLGHNAILQIGYVGSQGRQQSIVRDINQAALGSGFVDRPNAAGFTYPAADAGRTSQQFPNFGVIDQLESVGMSSYNSLQAYVRTRNWHGIISQFSYTLAHNLDEASNATSLPQDSNDLMGDYGNAGVGHPAPFRRLRAATTSPGRRTVRHGCRTAGS